jgi:hypothetical protein
VDGTAKRNDAETAAGPLARAVRAHLESVKRRVYRELKDYPPSIAGCDVQYKHLSERRDLVALELVRLERLSREGGAAAVDAFIRDCALIDEAAARDIRKAAAK